MKKLFLFTLCAFGMHSLHAQFTVTASVTNTTCNAACDGSVTAIASNGSPPYAFLWQPGNYTTQYMPGLCAGTYTVTVTDALASVASATVTVNQPAALTVSIAPGSPVICVGSSIAYVASVSGGTPPYTYSWILNGGNPATSTIQNPIVGYYTPGVYSTTVTVTDANGCTNSAATTLTVNANPAITFSNVIEASCNMPNGSATASGGVAYNWLPMNVAGATLTNVSPGTYFCVGMDANGCADTGAVFIGDSCDFVWPGDANDDAIADNLDIGIANGATGTTRANATLNWIGQPSAPWGQTLLSGTDYKWVDCDGNGIIQAADTNAVVQNFGLTHNNRLSGPAEYSGAYADLSVTLNQDSLAANSMGTLSISLGTSSVPATNVYGVAFTLTFDGAQIDATTFGMNLGTSWMGTVGTDLMGVVLSPGASAGSVQVAITRLNQVDAPANSGTIAEMGFMTTNALAATGNTAGVTFGISNVTVLSANESTQQVNTYGDSVIVADPAVLTGIETFGVAEISAVPNPFHESVQLTLPASVRGKNCDVTLTDAMGRVVLSQQVQNSPIVTIERGQLEAGVYFCTVRSEGMVAGLAKLVVE